MICYFLYVFRSHANSQYFILNWHTDIGNFPLDLGNFSVDLGNLPADLGNLPVDLGSNLSSLVDLLSQSFEGNRHYNAVFIKPDNIFPIHLRDPRYSSARVFRNMELDKHIR